VLSVLWLSLSIPSERMPMDDMTGPASYRICRPKDLPEAEGSYVSPPGAPGLACILKSFITPSATNEGRRLARRVRRSTAFQSHSMRRLVDESEQRGNARDAPVGSTLMKQRLESLNRGPGAARRV
jgi:hypothetical protein